MPRPRLNRQYDAIITDKLTDSLRNGKSIQAGLEEVNYLPSDHFRLMETSNEYKTQIDAALRDRSMLLLDESLTLIAALDEDLVSSTDVSAIKAKVDIYKTIAYSHDAKLRINNNNTVDEGQETYADFLQRLADKRSKSNGDKQAVAHHSEDSEPPDSDEDDLLTH
jgi:hypothetical protein